VSVGDQMTTDALCAEAIRRGFVVVDTSAGTAVATRFANKPLGSLNTKGYRVCTLHLDGIRKQVKMHRLVWIAANGVPQDCMVIDHINGQKADNRLANLRLVDQLANASNRRRYNGVANPAAKIDKSVADRVRALHSVLQSNRRVAMAFHLSPSLIGQIVRGERWT
jgi:hypothetical protein